MPVKKRAITMNFKATSPDEISVKEKDNVSVLDESNDRAFVMRLRDDGSEEIKGWIPKHVLDSESKVPEGLWY